MIEIDVEVKRQDFHLSADVDIAQGITGIYGKNGSGKTTLLHAIAGLVTPERGKISIADSVLYDSTNKVDVPIHKRRIGYVFQEGRLFPHLSVEKNLRYGMDKNSSNKDIDKLIELLSLRSLLDKMPTEISGGERQRVALGRSLLSDPQVMLLDEPFSAIDQDLKDQIIPYLTTLQEEWEIPFILISHNLKDLLKITDQLLIMDGGRVMAHGIYSDLLLAGNINAQEQVYNNVMEVMVDSSYKNSDVILLNHMDIEGLSIKVSSSKSRLAQGKKRLIIPSNEISLALNEIQDTSIQNQIPGIIMNASQIADENILLVDVGFPLAVTLSTESKKRLKLAAGTKVWCLIKASGLQVF